MSATRFTLVILPRADGYTGVHMTDLTFRDVVAALEHWFACCPVLVTNLTGGIFSMRFNAEECVRVLNSHGVDARVIPGGHVMSIPAESVHAFADVVTDGYVWQMSCAPVRQLLSAKDLATYNIRPGQSLGASHFGAEVFCDVVATDGSVATRDDKVIRHLINFLCCRGLDACGLQDGEQAAREADFARALSIPFDNHQAYYRIKRVRGELSLRKEDRVRWGVETFRWTGSEWESAGVQPMSVFTRYGAYAGRALMGLVMLPPLLVLGAFGLLGRALHWVVGKARSRKRIATPDMHEPPQADG